MSMDKTFLGILALSLTTLLLAIFCDQHNLYNLTQQSFLNYSKNKHILHRKRRHDRNEHFTKIHPRLKIKNNESRKIEKNRSFIITNISNRRQSVTTDLKLAETHKDVNKASLTHFTTLIWPNNDSLSDSQSAIPRDNCDVFEKFEDIIADCSNASLSIIPQYLPQNITHLLLDNNLLDESALFQKVFARYPKLKILNLGSNKISTLPEGVFEGLQSLLYLSVYNNRIAMDSKLNRSEIFAPLNRTLKYLLLHRNNPDPTRAELMYPDFALSFLSQLSNLSIDGLKGQDFGYLFGKLTKLIHLNLSGYYTGYCCLDSLTNTTFKYLGSVRYLNISGCYINGSRVEAGALEHFSQLVSLDMSNNYFLGLDAVGELMYGLRNCSTFKHLHMSRVVQRFEPCVVVLTRNLKYFKTTSLQSIDAMNNEIEMIEYGALAMLPPSLKSINLTNNKIMFGAYWKNMAKLVGLERLNLNGYFIPSNFPNIFPVSKFYCNTKDEISLAEDEPCVCGDNETCGDSFMLPLPSNLLTFLMHSNSLVYNIRNLSFCPNNSLVNVDVSSNNFQNLSGPITGLNHLKTLNLSSCFIKTIGNKFFDNLTSLEELYLYQNVLGDCLNDDLNGLVFDKLSNMKILNLSLNNLYHLNSAVFADMHNLEVLDLSMNSLNLANFSIKSMTKLRKVDLHKNGLASLSSEMRTHISDLIKDGINISVDMRQNPIQCDCDNLDFLQWVVDTGVFGNNFSMYFCRFSLPNQIFSEMTEGYERQVSLLNYSCHMQMPIFFTVLDSTLLMVFLLLIALLYRFRWTFRYWYHAAKLKMTANKNTDKAMFKYDVFVSYANTDIDFILQELCPKLKERNVNMLIHGEKFKVGRYITDNIYNAVVKSRRTLVVVTKHLLASHWCNYELQMARMESISTGRDVLVFIFLEEIPTSKLGKQVLSHIKSSTYMTYPKVPQQRVAFWDKLANDLRSN